MLHINGFTHSSPLSSYTFFQNYPLLTAHSFRAELKSKMGSGFPVEGATNLNELGYHPGAKSTVIFWGLGYQKLVEIMIAWFRKKENKIAQLRKKNDFQITNKILPWICPMKYLRYIYTKKKKLNLNLIWKAQCFIWCAVLSHSVVSDSLRPHGL